MSNIIIGGFISEGTTDQRFLANIIKRTFEDVAYSCKGEIEVYDITHIEIKQQNYNETVLAAAKQASNSGIMILCMHCDADSNLDNNVFENKILPALKIIENSSHNVCKNIVAVVPIYMTESWMLADIELIKNEIGTTKSNQELGFFNNPESISDPKCKIDEILRISFEDISKIRRRRNITLSELYQPIGAKINLQKLSLLPSYIKFRNGVQAAFKKLNYL